MSAIEIAVIAVLAICAALSWWYTMFCWTDTVGIEFDRADVERDIAIFRRARLNLMDPEQLAESQMAEDGPFQISVFAPDPLELHDEAVYQSTLKWIRMHLSEIGVPSPSQPGTATALTDGPKMLFWHRSSEQNPKIIRLVQRLHKDTGDNRLFQLVECVSAPDHIFFVDMTVHRFRDRTLKVYVNQRANGITSILQQLPDAHGQEVVQMLSQWMATATSRYIDVPEVGSRLIPTDNTDELPPLLRSWKIRVSDLENGRSATVESSQAKT